MVCRVCNLGHILKPSSHHAGLENAWFVGYAVILKPFSHRAGSENIWFVGCITLTQWALEGDIQTNPFLLPSGITCLTMP